ncbi:MAG: DUF362 domain-containing protein [Candidatus Sumerlaea chitinivorans]|nr:DUF362 domain-containing protein [Candidatus Sumerlaea chitinivorans]
MSNMNQLDDPLTKEILLCAEATVVESAPRYPATPPFHPSEAYPEYLFRQIPGTISSETNAVYAAVRETFFLMGLDAPHYGTPQWNPLGELIKPGQTVLLKPNWVRNFHDLNKPTQSLITHGSVLRAVLDYVALALGKEGRVIFADSPQNDAVFEEILGMSGIPEICAFYATHSSIQVEVYDLRIEYVHKIDGVLVQHEKLPGDPAGYVAVDLGADSAFEPVAHKFHMFRGAEYSLAEMQQHHRPGLHEYPLCRTILQADVLINLPKLKTHKKAGVTLSLKNMIGINGNKNWLPHHTEGVPEEGGDQFASNNTKNRVEHKVLQAFKEWFPKLGPLRKPLAKPIKALGKQVFGDTNAGRIRSGNWWGNDTIWRTCIDLKRILLYADKNGRMCDTIQRNYLTLIDGIVGGEGNGPLAPDDRECGLIIASRNPVVADAVAARIMGFDYRLIPIIVRAFDPSLRWPLTLIAHDEIQCRSNKDYWRGPITSIPHDRFNFAPHFGWTGHIRIGDPLEKSPVAS